MVLVSFVVLAPIALIALFAYCIKKIRKTPKAEPRKVSYYLAWAYCVIFSLLIAFLIYLIVSFAVDPGGAMDHLFYG